MEPKITPLSEPLNSFPHFMPNQVLTHTQLNELAVYLEQQDRFTRQRLIGIGIVCGLKPNLVFSAGIYTVEVSRGVGITSCGFLIDVPDALEFGRKKNYTTPIDYEPFLLGASPGTPIDCIELKPADSTESGLSNLTSNDVTDKIVVLFLDLEDKPNGKCIGENCDEKGNKWIFTLRVLLISSDKMEAVLKKTYTPNVFGNLLNTSAQREDFFNPAYQLPAVFVERFGNLNNNPNSDFVLSAIFSFPEFEETYRVVIQKSSVRIANAIFETYRLFKPIFDAQLSTTTNPFSGFDYPVATNELTSFLLKLIDSNNPDYKKGNVQYVYDFLRDLKCTYDELKDELFALASECSPDPTPFPRHLMIGELEANVFGKFDPQDYATPSVFRHHFLSSRILNGQSAHLKTAKMLISRLMQHFKHLGFSKILLSELKEAIRITPDASCCSKLGDQRIPFYYGREGSQALLSYWNFKMTIQNRALENRSYYAEDYVPDGLNAALKAKLKYPLLFDICGFPKLSIEGHVGKDLQTAVTELAKIRRRYNLSFDILALKLDQGFNEIAIADDSLIADLQLQYGVDRNELVCCLQELAEYIESNRQTILVFLSLIFYVLAQDDDDTSGSQLSAIQTYLGLILDAYEESIKIMVESLPADIKDFNFQKLHTIFPAFASFTTLFKYGINTWGDVEFFLMRKQESQNKWLISDLISVILNMWELYLDKVGDDCILGKFYSIYYAFYTRLNTFSIFSKFNESVHGMEHIAGTTKGGTFILVYDDQEGKIEMSGQAVGINEKPIEEAVIVDANNPNVIYGATDSKGYYNVSVPKGSSIRMMKAGYTAVDIKPTRKADIKSTAKKAKSSRLTQENKITMATYCDMAAGKKTDRSKLEGADKVFVNMKTSYDGLISMNKSYAKAADFLNLDMAASPVQPMVIGYKPSFRVVADFYLPYPIHTYRARVEPLDACEELRETKMLDFNMISKALGKEASAGKTKMSAENLYSTFRGKEK
jgi:hypothetical protein